ELARRRGRGSDPELQLGEAKAEAKGEKSPSPTPRKSKAEKSPSPTPRKSQAEKSPSPTPRKSKVEKGEDAPEGFDFNLPVEDDQVEIGQALNLSPGPSISSKKGPPSSKKKLPGPKSPSPTPGSDSDVRLVGDSGADLDFQLASDSDVKLVDDPGPKSSPSVTGPKSGSRLGSKPPSTRKDSSVRMVPDEDSGVKFEGGRAAPGGKSPSDSDVRVESPKRPSKLGGKKDELLTEEIDLDAELKKAEEASKIKPPKARPGSAPALPTTSPFELSESDINLP